MLSLCLIRKTVSFFLSRKLCFHRRDDPSRMWATAGAWCRTGQDAASPAREMQGWDRVSERRPAGLRRRSPLRVIPGQKLQHLSFTSPGKILTSHTICGRLVLIYTGAGSYKSWSSEPHLTIPISIYLISSLPEGSLCTPTLIIERQDRRWKEPWLSTF